MNNVGICTVYTGYNYGSALQAAATKEFLHRLGYRGEILKLRGSMIAGRDVRPKKLLLLGLRMLLHFPQAGKALQPYVSDRNKCISQESTRMFAAFCEQYIRPVSVSEQELAKLAAANDFLAFLCGSDQIWNSTSYYVDPFYYLSFSPKEKRIAFAPSFGRNYIPSYNRRKIKKNLQAIPYLSVREDSGQALIRELIGRPAEVLIDPTLLLDKDAWSDMLSLRPVADEHKYVLAYFLDEPSQSAKQALKRLSGKGCKILALPHIRTGDWFDACLDAGPQEFLQLLLCSDFVCTDSFHGTAFSLNFEKNFYTYEREYGSAANQSSRILSLLRKVGLADRFDPSPDQPFTAIDYTVCRQALEQEREKSKQFLLTALQAVKESSGGKHEHGSCN